MNRARALIGDVPESREELADILKVASGYAVVEPNRAFLFLAPLMEMHNDLMTAYSLLVKYSKQENFFSRCLRRRFLSALRKRTRFAGDG